MLYHWSKVNSWNSVSMVLGISLENVSSYQSHNLQNSFYIGLLFILWPSSLMTFRFSAPINIMLHSTIPLSFNMPIQYFTAFSTSNAMFHGVVFCMLRRTINAVFHGSILHASSYNSACQQYTVS